MQHGTPFSMRTSQPPGLDSPRVAPASDAFVISTLCFLWFLIGCFVMWAFLLWRRQKNLPQHSTQPTADHGDAEWRQPSSVSSPDETEAPSPAPWEKPADWWKK
jgi:hypothetical protein